MNNNYQNTSFKACIQNGWNWTEPMDIWNYLTRVKNYVGGQVFPRTEDGLVRDEDIYEFMERKYGKVETLED